MLKLTKTNEVGDTIIEVLVSLSVLAFILTMAYGMTSRSLQTIRRAHERSEAVQVAQGQIEQLKVLMSSNGSEFSLAATLPQTRPFCFSNANNTTIVYFNTLQGQTLPLNLDSDRFNTYAPACKNHDPGARYNVSITTTPPNDGNGCLFIVRVRWEKFGGGGNDEVKLEYKLYKDN